MTPEAALAAYRRQIGQHGETIILVRGDCEVSVRARAWGAEPLDNDGGVLQWKRKFIVLAEDVAAAADFELPFRPKQDRLRWNGRTLVITSADDVTRRVAGVLIAFEIETHGG